jgi:hypothetical protein
MWAFMACSGLFDLSPYRISDQMAKWRIQASYVLLLGSLAVRGWVVEPLAEVRIISADSSFGQESA